MGAFSGFEHVVREQEPLAPFTWFGLGGAAEYFAEPTSLEELIALVVRGRDEQLIVRVLGGGSNVLVRDEGVSGLVLHLPAATFAQIQVTGRTVRAGGGAKLGHVISTAVREGLGGLEELVGIPGTVGGAVHGNSGTHGGDISQWAAGATVLSRLGEISSRGKDDLRLASRQSGLDALVILDVDFELEPDDSRELTKRMQKLWIVKKASQPGASQRTGCLFRNANGISAGSLIEQAGLKGARVGDAELSDRDANFVVAGPRATSRDVLQLMELLKTEVSERLGVELETHLQVW